MQTNLKNTHTRTRERAAFFFFFINVHASITSIIFLCRHDLYLDHVFFHFVLLFLLGGLRLLFVLNIATWLSLLLLCGGDIHPNPGPQAAESSNDSSLVSNVSTDIFSHLSLHHNLSFVQYNVQSIVNKLDILQAELHDIDILSFTETWLSPDISTEDIILQSYNKPERKDRPEDPHGGVIIYEPQREKMHLRTII